MKLLGYNIPNIGTIGFDVDKWSLADLSGNTSIKIIDDNAIIPSGYTDISSIENWVKFGDGFNGMGYIDTRNEIKKLLTDAQITGDTSTLNTNEIEILADYQLDKYCLIYDYIDRLKETDDLMIAPFDQNYDILGLFKKRNIVKGELQSVEYYGEYDFASKTHSKLVVSEERTYYRINELYYKRDIEITWYCNDGGSSQIKPATKYYTQEESIQAGERRRRNIISTVKVNTIGLISMTSGVTIIEAEALAKGLLVDYANEINQYVEGSEQGLLDAISNDTTYEWLNNEVPNAGGLTIRLYLVDFMTIDYNINNTYQ